MNWLLLLPYLGIGYGVAMASLKSFFMEDRKEIDGGDVFFLFVVTAFWPFVAALFCVAAVVYGVFLFSNWILTTRPEG